MTKANTEPLALGQVVATPGALETLACAGVDALTLLARHVTGDWGELDKEDRAANDRAWESGEDRILSAYNLPGDWRIWIITEWDRSVTTLLLPEEY
jgi:hypothetical protein